MVAGVSFAIGCFIFAFTATPDVHWIGPCFGIVIIIGKSPTPVPVFDDRAPSLNADR